MFRSTNDGPAVNGELRIRGQQEGRSQYGVEVQLPPGAVQRFTLYAQTALFGSRIFVDLANGEQVVATQQVNIRSHDAYSPIVAVVAERPENVLPQVTDAMVNPNVATTTVIQLAPADLPPRVEAWAALDRLVWQDVDAAQLSPAQLEALKLWIGAGGRLTILGGTTGAGTLRGFGADLLPFDPQTTVEAAPADVAALLGSLPSDAVAVPALSGTLNRGSVLARSGEDVIAAESGYGRGVITLIGFDPAASWIADSSASDVLWRRLLPQTNGPALNPHDAVRRLADRLRAAEPALDRPAADRAAVHPAGRLHRADRPDQLPDPAPARQARMGLGDHPGARGRLRARLVRPRRHPQGLRRDRQRDRGRARRPGHRARHRPGLHRHLFAQPAHLRRPHTGRRTHLQSDQPGPDRTGRDATRRDLW